MGSVWIGSTDRYSLYARKGIVTIYDKLMNNHLPISLYGEEAEDFKIEINAIEITLDDKESNSIINAMCEKIRKNHRER